MTNPLILKEIQIKLWHNTVYARNANLHNYFGNVLLWIPYDPAIFNQCIAYIKIYIALPKDKVKDFASPKKKKYEFMVSEIQFEESN